MHIRSIIKLFSLLFLFNNILSCATSEEKPVPKAEAKKSLGTLFVGPKFLTLDPKNPSAKALLVDDHGIILQVLAKIPTNTNAPIVKLKGALAVPGLHDAHAHLEGVGKALEQVDLRGCTSPSQIRERIAAFLEKHPDVSSVQGRGWDQSLFSEHVFPTSALLDGLTDKIILVRRVDGHAALINDVLKKKLHLTQDSVDPKGGRYLRDEQNNPTGVLVDNAMDAAFAKLPKEKASDRRRWLLLGMQQAQRFGLTAVHDMGMSLETFAELKKLDAEEALPIRVYVYLYGEEQGALEAALHEKDGRNYAVQGIKFLMDGAMGSRGAALLEPYDDEPSTNGLIVADIEKLERYFTALDAAQKQLAVHAIGDRANRLFLDLIAQNKPVSSKVRHRVEHAQLISKQDFPRFAQLGVIASMQPTHATSDMRWIHRRVGDKRTQGAYAWRTFLNHKVPLAFGSDAPVESIDVRLGLYAATTRKNVAGDPETGFMPEQILTSDEALAAFSSGAVYAVHREKKFGKFVKGAAFDATLFAEDVRSTPEKWPHVVVTGTLLAGTLQTEKLQISPQKKAPNGKGMQK